jgi:hypothetical protein
MADEEVALQPPKLWIGELYYYFALIGEKLGPTLFRFHTLHLSSAFSCIDDVVEFYT